MPSDDSLDEDIVVDHDRVARDFALMRLEYLKFSTANHLDRSLEQVKEDFNQAQTKLLDTLDPITRKEESKVTQVFNKLLKLTTKTLTDKAKMKDSPDTTIRSSPPVLRSRRIASVEGTENVSSPATPTKKKGGRLAAKPLLDNIDENAPVSSPKPTRRKSMAREEPAEEKAMTPARRSVRIRSNTSITADTPQAFDSPRARRASRRNSLAGSDNETTTTPVKQTRRTRKDSTSSVENLGETVHLNLTKKQPSGAIIPEEPELQNMSNGSISNDENLSPNNSFRKSARISKTRKSSSNSSSLNGSLSVTKSKSKTRISVASPVTVANETISEENEKSLSSENPDPLNKINIITENNKVKETIENTSKRNLFTSSDTRSRESSHEPKVNNLITDIKTIEQDVANTNNNKSTIKPSNDVFPENQANLSALEKEVRQTQHDSKDLTDAADKNYTDLMAQIVDGKNETPVKCTVFIEDSSSNAGSIDKERDADDQCVPVLNQNTEETNHAKDNSISNLNIFQEKPRSLSVSTVVSCEPMDIDETIPENVSMTDFTEEHEGDSDKSAANHSALVEKKTKKKMSLSECDKSKSEEKANKSKSPANASMEIKTTFDTSELSTVANVMANKSILEKSETSITKSLSKESVNTSKTAMVNVSVKSNKRSSLVNQSIEKSKESDTEINRSSTELDGSQLKSALPVIENSKRKSKNKSLSQSNASPSLEKSSNENKSTLILSQIKDDETSLAKSPKLSNQNQTNQANVSLKVTNSSKFKNISNMQSSENTPIKEKSLINIGMHTSTPVVSENIAKNAMKREIISKRLGAINGKDKKHKEISNESENDSDSDESDFMDDKAQDAGEDYESGDSQDDEERQYVEENEIVERGETLDSDDEGSNDTDYEKDSFVVSSDEEDNELLDGSGDDLNLSDNELTMSAKSKKKYNERKTKEQKKASREMFESRHKSKSLYDSSSSEDENKPKKKNNRLRLDSSVLGSEDDAVRPKTNRMRINSTFDESNNTNTNKYFSKTKMNRLGSSMNASLQNEIEITVVCDKSMQTKKDPLLVDIKLEPKTPQKLNISTVNVSARLPIDEVHINENASMLATNETTDPLQENDEDSQSLCSENQDVMENYDSMLNELRKGNKHNSKKSLDLKKTDFKTNIALKNGKQNISKKLNEDDSSSDTIDLKLLFPDNDDSDSEAEAPADFIPLKKSQAKTDIHSDETIDLPHEDDRKENGSESNSEVDEIDGTSHLDDSQRKKDKKLVKPLLNQSNKNMEVENENLNMSVVHVEKIENEKDTSTNTSVFKENEEVPSVPHVETPSTVAEIQNLTGSGKKKKQRKSVSKNDDNDEQAYTNESKNNTMDILVSTEDSKDTSLSKKKKKKLSESLNKDAIDNLEETQNITSSGKKKKQKKTISKNDDTLDQEDMHITKDKSKNVLETTVESNDTSLSKKKTKKLSESLNIETTDSCEETKNTTSSSKKKKRDNSVSKNDDVTIEHIDNFILDDINNKDVLDQMETESRDIGLTKMKKKTVELSTSTSKDTSLNINQKQYKYKAETQEEYSELLPGILSQEADRSEQKEGSHKKKKNNSLSNAADTSQTTLDIEASTDRKENKKKNKKISEDDTVVPEVNIPEDDSEIIPTKSKKRKRRSSGPSGTELPVQDSSNADSILAAGGQNKKMKLANDEKIHTDENVAPEALQNVSDSSTHKKKKKNKKRHSESDEIIKKDSLEHGKKNKKRKERDEDSEQSNSKVFKESRRDNVHVSRLPNSLLKTLEDKSKPILPAPQIISTSNFKVEEGKRRKNKPSQYLEESVYLDSDSPDKTNVAGKIRKPKVLPFVPTASTSSYGFTSNFKVNVIPTETKFIAQSSNIPNFKNDYLYGKNIKRMGTYELYKKVRSLKLSKF